MKLLKIFGVMITALALTCNATAQTKSKTAETKYVLKISHTERVNSVKGKYFIRFKELMEEKYPNLKIELSAYGSVHKRGLEIEALELGLVDIVAPDVEDVFNATRDENLRAVNLPYLFETSDDYDKFLLSDASNAYVSALSFHKDKQFFPITLIGEGFEIFASNKQLKGLKDLKDRTIFTQSKLTNATLFNSLQAKNIQEVSYSDYDFPEKGGNEIYELSKDLFLSQELGDILSNALITNHKYKTSIVLMNKQKFKELPKNIQEGIIAFLHDNKRYNADVAFKTDKQFKDRVLQVYKKTMNDLSAEDQAELRKLAKPFHQEYLDNVNKEVLLRIYKRLQFFK